MDLIDSASAPPLAGTLTIKLIFVTPSIAEVAVKLFAPLAALLLVTTYSRITMLPSDKDLLITPSPK